MIEKSIIYEQKEWRQALPRGRQEAGIYGKYPPRILRGVADKQAA